MSADPACGRDAPGGSSRARFPSEPFALYAESSQELGRGGRVRRPIPGGDRTSFRRDARISASSRLSAARDGAARVRVAGRVLGRAS